ncbi:MAG: Holliday junction resolvase RuvX [Rhizobiaceae bacterium]
MSNVVDLAELKERLPNGRRLFGIDLGTKTIGIAVCNGGLSIATPFHTIRRTKFTQDAQKLVALANQEKVGGLVVGLPVNMDGTEGPRAQSTRAFVRNLARITDLPVAFQDERLSTVSAESQMLEAGTRRSVRRERIDEMAAAVILQDALERLNRL